MCTFAAGCANINVAALSKVKRIQGIQSVLSMASASYICWQSDCSLWPIDPTVPGPQQWQHAHAKWCSIVMMICRCGQKTQNGIWYAGNVTSPSGHPFPPFLVLERGVSAAEWLRERRSGPAVLNLFFDVAAQLVRLHRAGRVHGALAPGAVLWMLQTHTWKLIKFAPPADSGASTSVRRVDYERVASGLGGRKVATLTEQAQHSMHFC